AQDTQQIRHSYAGIATDEMQGAVVGAAKSEFLERNICRIGEVTVGEEQQVLRHADVGFGRFDLRFGHGRHSSRRTIITSAMLTYQRCNNNLAQPGETILRRIAPWSSFLSMTVTAGSGGMVAWSPGAMPNCTS